MGEFSWMFADKANKEALKFMGHGYLACPDGSFIEEIAYDGYGNFDGNDVYEMVVDWNRKFLEASMLQKPIRKLYESGPTGDKWYSDAIQAYERSKACMNDWKSGMVSETEMSERYGRDWKRNLGIDIACYDEQNFALPYPIKIVSDVNFPYDELPASMEDEYQGW